ncbi:MAG: antibiotic biosynthesis monooxygenase [Anaerolineales bacterium]|nr:MAG: antibiotic biosynthesis monooxygenase [Anaerolineales bacterium]
MSIGIIVEFWFKPGSEGAALLTSTMQERLSSVTRTYDGCEHVHLYTDPDNANHLILLQRWESREKYDKYRDWAMAQSGTEQLLPLLERDMSTRYFDDTGV